MISKRLGIAIVLFLLIISHVSALVTGYYRGYVDGRTVEISGQFRFHRSQVRSVLRKDAAYRRLEIQQLSGIAVVIGSLTQEQIASLKKDLIEKFGSSATKSALSQISVEGKLEQIKRERTD